MSVLDSLMEAVRLAITALDPPLEGATVAVRKLPVAVEGDPYPLVLITPGADRLDPATGEADFAYFGTYPVQVTYLVKSAGLLATDGQTLRGWRDRVKKAVLNWPAYSPAPVFDSADVAIDDVEYAGRPPFDRSTLAKGADVSAHLFTFRTTEGIDA